MVHLSFFLPFFSCVGYAHRASVQIPERKNSRNWLAPLLVPSWLLRRPVCTKYRFLWRKLIFWGLRPAWLLPLFVFAPWGEPNSARLWSFAQCEDDLFVQGPCRCRFALRKLFSVWEVYKIEVTRHHVIQRRSHIVRLNCWWTTAHSDRWGK